MATVPESSVSFAETDTRREAMHSTIEQWLDDLTGAVDMAQASEQFREWLDVQSRFHEYSHRNTLLIHQQCPEATRVAGYRTWQTEFDRYVKEGEEAIWIWAPIITQRCPECENAESYHEDIGCEYDETPPEEWSEGLVGFKPVPVFDISQTEGEPLPELDFEATGEAGDLVARLRGIAENIGVRVEFVPEAEWSHGTARGVCHYEAEGPRIEVQDNPNDADLACTLVHEYAHAMLHVDDRSEETKREVEAEAVAYIVGRYFGLDTGGSAFYLAAWADDDVEILKERLGRISRASQEILNALGE
jgi:hypothetical protein